jgi:hypothetical protein
MTADYRQRLGRRQERINYGGGMLHLLRLCAFHENGLITLHAVPGKHPWQGQRGVVFKGTRTLVAIVFENLEDG